MPPTPTPDPELSLMADLAARIGALDPDAQRRVVAWLYHRYGGQRSHRENSSKGGHAAAANMTPEERRERGRKAAAGRWGKSRGK